MKTGCPIHPRRDPFRDIEWIAQNSFDFVDLFMEEDQSVPEKIDAAALRELLARHSLEAVGHTAWYLPIGSPMRALRTAAVKEIERYFAFFSKVPVDRVTIHSNWPGGMFSAAEGLTFQIESLREIVRIGAQYGIRAMYEPVDSPDDHAGHVRKILGEVPDLLFHLDIGHANLHGRTPASFIEEFHEKLAHVHLHDNIRNQDLHLPMGCGSVNWDRTLSTLKKYYDGTITLEVFSPDPQFIVLSRDRLRKAWDSV